MREKERKGEREAREEERKGVREVREERKGVREVRGEKGREGCASVELYSCWCQPGMT